MASTDYSIVLGLDEVVKKLERLPNTFALNLLRRSMRAGGVPILQHARRAVATRYGALRDSLEVVTDRVGPGRTQIVVRVRVSPKAWLRTPEGRVTRAKRAKGDTRRYYRGEIYPRNYAHLVEFGTRPRAQGKGLHPGTRPRSFMGSAFEARKEEAIRAVQDRARQEMLKMGREL